MDIKDVIVRINKLHSKEQLHILNILKTNDVKFSKNSNGYFFNFIDINNETLDKIYKCLELIESNTDLLKEMDKRRNELLLYYKQLIEDKLNAKIKIKKDNYIQKLKLLDSNIKFNIKRVNKINKRILYDKNMDIDIVMKEYLKSKSKYKKDSVYYKINSKIRYKKSFEIKKSEREDYEEGVNVENIDIDENLDEPLDEPLDDPLDESDFVKDDFSQDEFENSCDNTHDNDNENDNTEDDILSDNDKTNEIEMELEMDFYRKLLNQQGFVFDDNKRCLLQPEEYII